MSLKQFKTIKILNNANCYIINTVNTSVIVDATIISKQLFDSKILRLGD